MGVKRGRGGGGAKSEDKRARFEAGLDLASAPGLEDAMLEQIAGEVRPPKQVQAALDTFVAEMVKFIKQCPLPKVSTSSLENLPVPLTEHFKFPGAKVTSCEPVGALKSKSLVFPNAVGEVRLVVQYSKVPESGDTRRYARCVLAQLASALRRCPLVLGDSLQFCSPLTSASPELVLVARPATKLGRHFQLQLRVGEVTQLEQELDTLTSTQPHLTAARALEVWRRQVGLVLPGDLLSCLLLHCHVTGLTSAAMKPWQIVKKVWGLVAGLGPDLGTARQLILGLSEPVPAAAGSAGCPLLARDGETALCPGLGQPQWRSLAQLAARCVHQGVEAALLRSLRPAAVFDRVYEVAGEADTAQLVRDLARALDTRVTMLAVLGGRRAWRVGGEEGGVASLTVELGVRWDPDLHWKPSTLGPLANCETAAEFRQFWGERSELRRLQDGEVREVVVWGGDRSSVVTEVVTAVIARHHKGCSLEERGRAAELLLAGDGGRGARAALDQLVPVLYGLEDLPLKIAGVAATGEQGRSSLVSDNIVMEVGGKTVTEERGVAKLSSKAGMAPRSVQPLEVTVIAEQSGKWPRDPEARRRVAAAWLQELGRRLQQSEAVSCVARLRGERLLVRLDTEAGGCQVLSLGLATSRSPECEVTSWLASVDTAQAAWSGAARLAKRWVAAHLLSSVPDLAVEVSVAVALAVSPLAPQSAGAGLAAWLHTLATHDWNTAALVHPDTDPALRPARAELPPLAVLCPHSPAPSHWTREVTWPELQRLVSLASAALASLDTAAASPLEMFTPSLDCYEALIHLKPLQVATRHLAVTSVLEAADKPSSKKTDSSGSKTIPIVDHDCVSKYVGLLSTCYSHLARFYYDKYGGTVIGVKIVPDKGEAKVKVGDFRGRMLQEGRAVTNWAAVIEDWSILGDGLVKNVEVINTDILL